MKRIQIKKLVAQNFFCFGNDGIEIDFKKFGNIVLVNGKNLDSSNQNNDAASNGAGKSSIPEIIVYGFYGKTIKKPKKLSHKDVINNQTGKKLKIEIEWDRYKLQRTRKPDGLRLWESDQGVFDDSTEITLGGMPATQKKIEEILGLSYESFVNIAVFTDNNSVSFLECDAADKRVIVENLLSLEKFRTYQDSAKQLFKQQKDNLATLQLEFNNLERNKTQTTNLIEKYKKDIKDFKINLLEKYKKVLAEIDAAQKEVVLITQDDQQLQKYQQEQSKIPDIDAALEEIDPIKVKINNAISKAGEVIDKAKSEIANLENEISEKRSVKIGYENSMKSLMTTVEKISRLEKGVICQHCYGVVSEENYDKILKEHKDQLGEIKIEWENIKQSLELVESQKTTKIEQKNSLLQVLNLQEEKLKTINKKQSDLLNTKNSIVNMKKPDSETKVSGLNEKIKLLKQEADKQNPDSAKTTPYDQYLTDAQQTLVEFEAEEQQLQQKLDSIRSEMKYYEYWTTAFGDQGIRKYVIDGIVPALNDNLAHWLNVLIDNNLRIRFDNQFEEFIDKLPEESQLSYFAISGGQKRRINLALSQAFAHIMSLNTGRMLDIIFLDEVTSNIDKVGAEAIYRMILQLSQEKQVFVTTHDQNLLEFLKGVDNMTLVMQNGVSKLEK